MTMPQTILSAGLLLLISTTTTMVAAFSVQQQSVLQSTRTSNSALSMISVGLGPKENDATNTAEPELVPGVDYEVPDHEAYRTSRRTKLDEECDAWYKTLLGEDDSTNGFLGTLAQEMRERVLTPVELKNEVCQSMESRSLSLCVCVCVSSFHSLFNSTHTNMYTFSHLLYCLCIPTQHTNSHRLPSRRTTRTTHHTSTPSCPGHRWCLPLDWKSLESPFHDETQRPGANSMWPVWCGPITLVRWKGQVRASLSLSLSLYASIGR